MFAILFVTVVAWHPGPPCPCVSSCDCVEPSKCGPAHCAAIKPYPLPRGIVCGCRPSCDCGGGCDCECGPDTEPEFVAAEIPPCGCGCVKTGSCQCKNCDTHTADPNWKPDAADVKPIAYPSAEYEKVFADVAAGKAVTFTAGAGFPGPAGVYRCSLRDGKPFMQPVVSSVLGYTIPANPFGSCGPGGCPTCPRR